MLEMLAAGGGKPYYPKSGPGPKSLQYGNDQAGYFGTLNQSELFTPTELMNALNIPAFGASVDSSLLWVKFYYQGNIVYVPTKPVNLNTQLFSWESLYQQGLVYGIDGDGTYPSPAGSPYNQRTVITKTLEGRTAGFWVQLPDATGVDPDTPANANASTLGVFNGLLAKVFAQGVGSGNGKWDSLDASHIDANKLYLTKTTQTSNPTINIYSRHATSTPGYFTFSTIGKPSTSTNVFWVPLLRYLNPTDNLLDLTDYKLASPPPMPVDMVLNTGGSTGGVVNMLDVTAALPAKAPTATAVTTGLLSPINFITKAAGLAPQITARTAEPLHSPVVPIVKNVGPTPVPIATSIPTVYNPFALTASYDPKPLTGLKLVDQ